MNVKPLVVLFGVTAGACSAFDETAPNAALPSLSASSGNAQTACLEMAANAVFDAYSHKMDKKTLTFPVRQKDDSGMPGVLIFSASTPRVSFPSLEEINDSSLGISYKIFNPLSQRPALGVTYNLPTGNGGLAGGLSFDAAGTSDADAAQAQVTVNSYSFGSSPVNSASLAGDFIRGYNRCVGRVPSPAAL